ncbi:MAG: peptidoglycan DD-metalloendopeptidase family protein [bacterium]
MDDKLSFAERVDSFFSGKGFYIVLFVSVAVIAVSAWLLMRPAEVAEEPAPLTIPVDAAESPVTVPPAETEVPVMAEPLPAAPHEPEKEVVEPVEEAVPVGVPAVEEPRVEEPREDEPESVSAPETPQRPVSGGLLTPWSPETLVYSRTMDDWRAHHGVDLEAGLGTRVVAMASGTVVSVREDDRLGTVVTIDHPDGLRSVYANLAAQPTVSVGDSVAAGAVIGSVGTTALFEIAEPSHLHLEVYRDGAEVDPMEVLP